MDGFGRLWPDSHLAGFFAINDLGVRGCVALSALSAMGAMGALVAVNKPLSGRCKDEEEGGGEGQYDHYRTD